MLKKVAKSEKITAIFGLKLGPFLCLLGVGMALQYITLFYMFGIDKRLKSAFYRETENTGDNYNNDYWVSNDLTGLRIFE